jgi:hypothetical protein
MIFKSFIRILFAATAILFITAFESSAQTVEIIMQKEVFTDQMKTEFVVRCSADYDIEMIVFSGEFQALYQKSTLTSGDNKFDLHTPDLPEGKYFILVTGEGIHVEKEFFVARKN